MAAYDGGSIPVRTDAVNMGILFHAANVVLDGGGNLGGDRFGLCAGAGRMEAAFFDKMGLRDSRGGSFGFVHRFDTLHGQFQV